MEVTLLLSGFIASFVLAWLLFRGNRASVEASLRALEESNMSLQEAIITSKARESELLARVEASQEMLREKQQAIDLQRADLQDLQGKLAVLVAKEADASARLATERSAIANLRQGLDGKIDDLESEVRALRAKSESLSLQNTDLGVRIEAEKKSFHERLSLLAEAEKKLSDAFQAVSANALSRNNQTFLELAKATLGQTQEAARGELEKRQQAITELVGPVQRSLEKVDEKLQHIETLREGAYSELRAQVRGLTEAQVQLRSETGKLVTALRSPSGRGKWGEMQLRRVVEMAGMLEYCDFSTQTTVRTDDAVLRPDMVVRLPGGKSIVVDAKTPLLAYLSAIEATDESVRASQMKDHARQVRDHLKALSQKSYFEQFEPTPEFVVLFLPGESFFAAALDSDPSLIEAGVEKNVILATPTTLIALLRAVAYGWRQEALAQNAAEISVLGRELFKELTIMVGHWNIVGKRLGSAVKAYNLATGSLESRVLNKAGKFEELKAAPVGVEMPEAVVVEREIRRISESDEETTEDGLLPLEPGGNEHQAAAG